MNVFIKPNCFFGSFKFIVLCTLTFESLNKHNLPIAIGLSKKLAE